MSAGEPRKPTAQILLSWNKTAKKKKKVWSKVIRRTQVSQKQCQDSDLATAAPAPCAENLGTSGKSLGERLAAGLGDGVRPE